MAKLSPDYIQFVLSLSTDRAQQEIHKLEKASSELKNENKDLRKSMADLTASGKRNSEEYRNLEAQYKKNNRAIAENNAKTQELLRTTDTQNKSYKQLSQEYQTATTGAGQHRKGVGAGTIRRAIQPVRRCKEPDE